MIGQISLQPGADRKLILYILLNSLKENMASGASVRPPHLWLGQAYLEFSMDMTLTLLVDRRYLSEQRTQVPVYLLQIEDHDRCVWVLCDLWPSDSMPHFVRVVWWPQDQLQPFFLLFLLTVSWAYLTTLFRREFSGCLWICFLHILTLQLTSLISALYYQTSLEFLDHGSTDEI